jgi:hypothetical protein
MKKVIKIGIVFSFLLVGCKLSQQMKLEPESFLKWYSSKDNLFKSMDTLNGVSYTIASYPQEVSIAICALNKCEPKEVLITDLKTKSAFNTYLLEIQSLDAQKDLFQGKGSKGMSKNDQVLYLSNDIKYDLKALTEDGDTLKCVSVIYEPLLSGSFRLILDFEISKSEPIDHIIYNDRLINRAQIAFGFPKNNHSNFPLLNLNNYE